MKKTTTKRTNNSTKKTVKTKTERKKSIPKFEQSFLEGISCDIYVGKKAGISVRNAIRKAKKSITVISPFLSGDMITEDIFEALNKDVQVNIISKDNERIYPFLKKNLYSQNPILGSEKWLFLLGKSLLIFFYIIFSIAVLEIFTSFIFDVSFTKNILPISKNNFLAFTIIFGILTLFLRKLTINHEFYSSKRDNFNVHILEKSYNLHSKIYIIDSKIAFLGSLNFTTTGFLFNHETCIRITDKSVIRHLNNVYKDLIKTSKSIPLGELKKRINQK